VAVFRGKRACRYCQKIRVKLVGDQMNSRDEWIKELREGDSLLVRYNAIEAFQGTIEKITSQWIFVKEIGTRTQISVCAKSGKTKYLNGEIFPLP
jgi:hypothetical protein